MNDLNELYREVILDHYQYPRHKGTCTAPCVISEGKNPLCGDELTLYLTLDGETISDVTWNGHGCSICMASASMLAESVHGISIAAAKEKLQAVVDMMHGKGIPAELDLGDLPVLEGVKQFPVRIKCALLAWTTLQEGLNQHGNEQRNDTH